MKTPWRLRIRALPGLSLKRVPVALTASLLALIAAITLHHRRDWGLPESIEGNLFRVAGKDADAIGKEPVEPPALQEGASDDDVEVLAWRQLRTCYDPEIPINVVELGLVYRCVVVPQESGQRRIEVEMTLTAPGCGMGEVLVDDVRSKLELIPTVIEADVELVFDPPWNQSMMSEAARLETGMF